MFDIPSYAWSEKDQSVLRTLRAQVLQAAAIQLLAPRSDLTLLKFRLYASKADGLSNSCLNSFLNNSRTLLLFFTQGNGSVVIQKVKLLTLDYFFLAQSRRWCSVKTNGDQIRTWQWSHRNSQPCSVLLLAILRQRILHLHVDTHSTCTLLIRVFFISSL